MILSPSVSKTSLSSFNIEEGVDLFPLIAALSGLDPQEIHAIENLKKQCLEEMAKVEFSPRCQRAKDFIGRLIFHQFPQPELAAFRELITNSLDAQVRAGRENQQIEVNVSKGKMKVRDQGDSMDLTGIVTCLIPGRSSNPEAIFELDKGIPKVKGKYGHGFVAVFYYLAYEWLKRTASLPAYKKENEHLSLTLLYENNEQSFEAIFTVCLDEPLDASGNLKIAIDTHPLQKGMRDKKITLLTQRDEEAYKVKFRELKRSILVNIKRIKSEERGTTIKVTSPLIHELQEKLIEYAQKTFRFILSTPIEINGMRMNPLTCYQRLDFGGVILHYTSLKDPVVKGNLSICEAGNLVADYQNEEGGYVPADMAVSFDKLPQTSDRASVPFQDSRTLASMSRVLQGIFNSDSLNAQEKAVLLNGLYKILIPEHFNLLNQAKELVWNWINKNPQLIFVPHTPKMRKATIENAIYLHSDYFQQIPYSPFYQKGNRALFTLPLQQATVGFACELGPTLNVFLNQAYFQGIAPCITWFNLYLLEKWFSNVMAKEKDKELFLDKKWLQMTFLPKPPQKSVSETLPTLLLKEYEKESDANESLSSENMLLFIQQEVKRFPPATAQELLEWFKSLKETNYLNYNISKKFYRYLCDFVVNYPEILVNDKREGRQLAFHWAFGQILQLALFEDLSIVDTLCRLFYHHAAVGHYKSEEMWNFAYFLEKCVVRKELMKCLDLVKRFPHLKEQIMKRIPKISEEELKSKYEWVLELINKAQIQHNISDAFECCKDDESLDLVEALIDKIPHPALKQIPLIGKGCDRLSDLSTLLAMNSVSLTELLALLPKSMNEFVYTWNAEDYQFIERNILPLKCQLKSKMMWIKGYKYIRSLCETCLPLQKTFNYRLLFNAQAFALLLAEEVSLDSSLEHATAVAGALNQALANLMMYTSYCQQVLTYTENPCFEHRLEAEQGNFEPLPGFKTKQESQQAILQLLSHLTPKPNGEGLREWILTNWEKAKMIPDLGRAFIYAAIMGNNGIFLSTDYSFNHTLNGKKAIFLHHDPDVLGEIANSSDAKAAIEEAVSQALTAIPQHWMLELIKNGQEAGANEIAFEVHCTEDKSLVVVVEDDGSGMTSEEMKMSKIPGKTTKRKELEDPNFGIGWKSALAEFNKIKITSSKDGQTACIMLLTKTSEGILIQEDVKVGEYHKGTTFEMIKEACLNPLFDFIKLKSRLISRAQHIEGVDILFQDDVINECERVTPKINLSELLYLKGIYKGEATIEIGLWDEGLFIKGMKMAPRLPEKYLSLVPDALKKCLNSDQAKFRIFLPQLEQVFNRSLLVDEKSILSQIQKSVLTAACNYLAASWLQGKHLNLLSNEYWCMYEVNPATHLTSIEELYREETTAVGQSGFINEEEIKQELLASVQNHFKELPQAKFPYTFLSNPQDLTHLLQAVKKQDDTLVSVTKGEKVRAKLDHARTFITFMRQYSLKMDGLSLDSLCLALKQALAQEGILKANSKYDVDFIASKDMKELATLVSICFENLKKNLEVSYHSILQNFIQHTMNKLRIIKNEGIQKDKNPKEIQKELSISLASFLKKVASQLLGTEIEIHFDAKNSGHAAYTKKGTNELWINPYNHAIDNFLKIAALYAKNSHTTIGIEEELVVVCVEWLEILAHEKTHMEDGSECYNLHDAEFYDQTACLMESLFAKPGSTSPQGFDLFLEALNLLRH